jgi:tRNA1Val (adenine37-N6)-methyltransferase
MQMSRAARLTALELQRISVDLLRKTVELNGLGRRVRVVQADLRAPEALQQHAPFDLITANPPYLSVHSALHSPHPQRAAARLELNGDVFDYCRAAARLLAPLGRFCFCHAAADGRPERAVHKAGLSILTRQDVVFRQGRPPTIALFTCALHQGVRQDLPPLIVRLAGGQRSAAYHGVRRALNIEA